MLDPEGCVSITHYSAELGSPGEGSAGLLVGLAASHGNVEAGEEWCDTGSGRRASGSFSA